MKSDERSQSSETQMEVDEPIPSTSTGGLTMSASKHDKPKDYISPSQANEAGIRQWAHEMLCGHPGSRATAFEQLVNSYAIQFKASWPQ